MVKNNIQFFTLIPFLDLRHVQRSVFGSFKLRRIDREQKIVESMQLLEGPGLL